MVEKLIELTKKSNEKLKDLLELKKEMDILVKDLKDEEFENIIESSEELKQLCEDFYNYTEELNF